MKLDYAAVIAGGAIVASFRIRDVPSAGTGTRRDRWRAGGGPPARPGREGPSGREARSEGERARLRGPASGEGGLSGILGRRTVRPPLGRICDPRPQGPLRSVPAFGRAADPSDLAGQRPAGQRAPPHGIGSVDRPEGCEGPFRNAEEGLALRLPAGAAAGVLWLSDVMLPAPFRRGRPAGNTVRAVRCGRRAGRGPCAGTRDIGRYRGGRP
jgi:hypothetical protein